MDILRTHSETVLSPQNGRLMTQLQGASGRGRMGEGAGVVGNEVDVELLSVQQPSKAIEAEGKTGSQLLAQIERPEVCARAEEVAPSKVQRPVLPQQTQGQGAGLFNAVARVQEGQRCISAPGLHPELRERLPKPGRGHVP